MKIWGKCSEAHPGEKAFKHQPVQMSRREEHLRL